MNEPAMTERSIGRRPAGRGQRSCGAPARNIACSASRTTAGTSTAEGSAWSKIKVTTAPISNIA